jgi:hypothetical protein
MELNIKDILVRVTPYNLIGKGAMIYIDVQDLF